MKKHTSQFRETEEIYIRLDHYDDIFSDFDMRPYSDRALSIDFLDEIKRAVSGKNGNSIELVLHAPEKNRDEAQEKNIQSRLAAHFARHYRLLSKEKNHVLKLGIGMVVLGILCMILVTFVVFKDPTHSMFLSFLVVFLEPAAWFLLWEGMDQIVFHSKNINPELHFYRKMADSQQSIHFRSY